MPPRKKKSSTKSDATNLNSRLRTLVENFEDAMYFDKQREWASQLNDLLARGADPNIKTRWDRTLLHLAADLDDSKLIKRLLDKSLPINGRDDTGHTPLHNAAFHDSAKAAFCLIKAGADVNAAREFDVTPLHDCAAGNARIVDQLIKSGANVNARNKALETPLHYAASYALKTDTLDLLIKAGADIEARNEDGRTPLFVALEERNIRVAQFLINSGAQYDITDAKGWTPLHLAAKYGKTELCRQMIEGGVDPRKALVDGKTPDAVAREAGHPETADWLEKEAVAHFISLRESKAKELHNTNLRKLDSIIRTGKRNHGQ